MAQAQGWGFGRRSVTSGGGRRHATWRLALAVASTAAIMALAPAVAFASHFRYGNLSWQQAGPTVGGATPVTFRNEQAWRLSAFGPLEVGDVVSNPEGCIDFGDGTPEVCPMYRVTVVNTAEDYVIMHAVAPGSTTDPNVPHTYATAGPFTATTSSCCTISTLNNADDAPWRIASLVDLAGDDESPRSTVPPIVQLPEGGVQSFTMPAVDAGGETLRFRLTTAQESCLGCPDPHPPGLTIDPTTGRVSWVTTGREGLWWTGVVVEALVGGQVVSSTQIDYIIRVAQAAANHAPSWDDAVTPADGTVFTVEPGEQVSFALRATDPDLADTVQIIQNSGPGTLTSNAGNPATATFAYTAAPSDVGTDLIVQFLAQDNGSPPLGPPFRSYIVRVADATPPVATIVSGPSGVITEPAATFAFSSNEADTTFECRVDDGPFTPCTSPFTIPLLGPGPHTFEVRAIDAAGNRGPVASRSFTVAAPATGAGVTNDRDRDTIVDPSDNCVDTPNRDQADADEDGIGDVCDDNDASAGPTVGETVVARVMSGDVFFRLPPANRRRGGGRASQAARNSRPLKGAGLLPVGTVLDTTTGRVRVTSHAGGRTSRGAKRTQASTFRAGIFHVRQRRARNAITDITLRSPSATPYDRVCGTGASASGGPTAAAAQRRSRRVVSRLWADGRGRFRTRGRHSAATVRGTRWLTQNRCDGTLTVVRQGTVRVFDRRANRTVTVRAGNSYLARARRATVRARTP